MAKYMIEIIHDHTENNVTTREFPNLRLAMNVLEEVDSVYIRSLCNNPNFYEDIDVTVSLYCLNSMDRRTFGHEHRLLLYKKRMKFPRFFSYG